jgi:hypothetical protein
MIDVESTLVTLIYSSVHLGPKYQFQNEGMNLMSWPWPGRELFTDNSEL